VNLGSEAATRSRKGEKEVKDKCGKRKLSAKQENTGRRCPLAGTKLLLPLPIERGEARERAEERTEGVFLFHGLTVVWV